ncbi:glycosyltransferase family 4 protein [Porphyromonas gingivalis]|nr:glycosyltransferase family 4 protein [Porphyromonas gingivalis]
MIGGIETYLFNLSSIFLERRIEPIIVQCAKQDSRLEEDGITYWGIRLNSMASWHKQLYHRVKAVISKEDVLIWGTDTFSMKTSHRRSLSIQHGIDFDYYPEEEKLRRFALEWGSGKLYKWFQRSRALRVFNRASMKVCVDYNFWNWYRTFCLPKEEENVYVIPNFAVIEPREFCTGSGGKDAESLKVLFARRFVRRRGVDVMIEVVEHFQGDKRFRFTFAGEGPEIKKIQDLQERLGNVDVTSYRADESIKFHRNYDIAIVPTIGSEGTSFSLLEAMSAGLVVVCTAVGGMTNIVLDGFNGLFVRPGVSSDIIYRLEELYCNPNLRKDLASNAEDTIAFAFSYEHWKVRWNRVIDKLLQL